MDKFELAAAPDPMTLSSPVAGPSPPPLPPLPPPTLVQKPAATAKAKVKVYTSPEEELQDIKETLQKEHLLPKDIPIDKEIGKQTNNHIQLMNPQVRATDHEARPLLDQYVKEGCPTDCGEPWSQDTIELLLKRGPHISAKEPEAVKVLRQETADKVSQGYARVVKWKDIKTDMPKNLKISPVAMIPHKSKAFRCILDLSFNFKHKGKKYPSVNECTNKKFCKYKCDIP